MIHMYLKLKEDKDFPGGTVGLTLLSQHRGPRFNSLSGN